MNTRLTRAWLGRAAIVMVTIVVTWGALLVGQQRSDIEAPQIGQPSPSTFLAESFIAAVPDVELTESLREAAAAEVDPEYKSDAERTQEIVVQIGQLFDAVKDGVFRTDLPTEVTTTTSTLPVEPEPTTTVSTTTTTTAEGEEPTSTTTTSEPVIPTSDVTGFLYLDGDGNGEYEPEVGDAVLSGITVTLVDEIGSIFATESDDAGEYSFSGVAAGDITVSVDGDDPRLDHFSVSIGEVVQTLTTDPDDVITLDIVGFAPMVHDLETQAQVLRSIEPFLQPTTITTLTELATADVMRVAQGQSSYLNTVRLEAIDGAEVVLREGIKTVEELDDVKADLATDNPPIIFLDGTYNEAASLAAGDAVGINLQINEVPDEAKTVALQQQARLDVPDQTRDYRAGEEIVAEGETVTALHLAALDKGGLLKQTGLEVLAMLAVVTMLVGMLSFYLARFRQQFWANTRRVILFGVLIALAAGAARLIDILTTDNLAAGYLIPAATFGFMAAILFDARIGVIMSMAVGALTAIATRDPGLSLFALLSAMTPIPFVSAISARGDLRRAIIYTAMALAPLAAAISWFFTSEPETAALAALYGFLNGFLSGLVGVTAVSFFEIIFDITTTLRLLDLTDRNHPALQMLEEKARGTFNHSLLVGTLGDRAAKSINANNLLVRASAYYHDLGKTENPQFFIENQFGISNPHDNMPPEESAQAIRQHVIDGMKLAKVYRIPALVADSVLAHHGDGIMRYFYHKAIDRYGEENVNVDDYRHHGHKPRTKENAILMMADALEGASRAVFADDDPSPEKIRRVVERVVGEKVADGQLSESALTLGELTRVREAFVDALIGHYHQRIPYPDFPEPSPPSGGDQTGSDDAGDADRTEDGQGERSPGDMTDVEFLP